MRRAPVYSLVLSSSATYREQDERLCVCVSGSCDSGSAGSEALQHAKTIKNATVRRTVTPYRNPLGTSSGEYNLERNRGNRGNYEVAVTCDPLPRHHS